MFLIHCGVCCAVLVYGLLATNKADQITYIRTEHPNVTFNHPDYIPYLNLTSKRYGRTNPVYYVGLNMEAIVPLSNEITVDFYFYEFLTNTYKRSFVEMHYRLCKLIKKDMFFGAALNSQPALAGPCPYPPGSFRLSNMTILPDAIPKGFPFTKGRIYCNFTYVPKNLIIASGHIDMEIRTLKVNSRIKNQKL